MGALTKAAFVVLGISFMTFVTFFGRLPALRNTPIAFIYRLLWTHLPDALIAADQRLTSGRLTSGIARFAKYIFFERHPAVLIFFFLLLSVGESLYLPTAWPLFPLHHKLSACLITLLPYLFLYLAAASDPGTITLSNHPREMARYPYDYALFHPGVFCPTCRLLKAARSKHCSMCKRCIARLDHHCIFINNCVGAGNYHWFLLLLASVFMLNLYGGIMGLRIMVDKMQAQFAWWKLWKPSTGQSWQRWLLVWSWGMQDNAAMGSVSLLALLTAPLVVALLSYHLWLICGGTTTNESMKWSDWQAEMSDGCAFKRELAADRVKNLRIEPEWTRWPAEAVQILVRTVGKRPPGSDLDLPGVGEWEQVWRLKDVENLYDIGLWNNFVDVFRPWHVYRDTQVLTVESSGKRTTERNRRRRLRADRARIRQDDTGSRP